MEVHWFETRFTCKKLIRNFVIMILLTIINTVILWARFYNITWLSHDDLQPAFIPWNPLLIEIIYEIFQNRFLKLFLFFFHLHRSLYMLIWHYTNFVNLNLKLILISISSQSQSCILWRHPLSDGIWPKLSARVTDDHLRSFPYLVSFRNRVSGGLVWPTLHLIVTFR